MIKRNLTIFYITAALLLLTHAITVFGIDANPSYQSKPVTYQESYTVVSNQTYEKVLDILFPREKSGDEIVTYSIVLRFKPSFHTESQIVIRRLLDKIEVFEYMANRNIYDQLNKVLAKGGKEDAVEMAKNISINKRQVTISPAQLDKFYAELFPAITSSIKLSQAITTKEVKTNVVDLIIDGTFYNIWFERGLDKISLSLYDIEVDKKATPIYKVVGWMNAVRVDIKNNHK